MKFKSNFNIFIQVNAFENVVWEMAAIFSRGRWVYSLWPDHTAWRHRLWSSLVPVMNFCSDGTGLIRHHSDVIMGVFASQITSLMIVYSTVYSGADERKHQSSVSLDFVRGIQGWPLNSPHKGPVTREMFPFYDVIMIGRNQGDEGWHYGNAMWCYKFVIVD